MYNCEQHNLQFKTSLKYAVHKRWCEYYEKPKIKCIVCGSAFKVKPHEILKGKKYCSSKCYFSDQSRIPNIGRFKKGSNQFYGKDNPNWHGDKVGYAGIHKYIRSRLNDPKLCSDCNKKKPLDLANISGKYMRNIHDWEYLCRKCHMIKDGRLKELHRRNDKMHEL